MDPYVPMVSKSAPHVNTTNVLDPVSANIPVKLKKKIGLENMLIYRFYLSLLKDLATAVFELGFFSKRG